MENRKIKWFAPFRLESFRKYAPWYKLMQYFYSFLSVQMIWICVVAGRWISYLVKIYSFRDGTLEKVWGWGWEFSSHMRFPFYDFFFRPLHEYFLALPGVPVWIFFLNLIFPCANVFFCTSPPLTSPPPLPYKFSNGPSLNHNCAQNFHLDNLSKWWELLIHQCELCNACQVFERGMKRDFLTTNKFY